MARPINRMVIQTLGAECPNGNSMLVVARYDTRDPLAVVFQFDGRRRGIIDWRFSRDLLVEALLWGRAGDGDVQFAADESSTDRVWLILDSPDGHAELRLSVPNLADLVARIERLVPGNSEQVDWDTELRHLADWGAA